MFFECAVGKSLANTIHHRAAEETKTGDKNFTFVHFTVYRQK